MINTKVIDIIENTIAIILEFFTVNIRIILLKNHVAIAPNNNIKLLLSFILQIFSFKIYIISDNILLYHK